MDYYELEQGEKIYPLLKVEMNGKNYLYYSYKESNLTYDDIYVGEEVNDELLPVDNNLMPLLKEKCDFLFI